MLKRFFFVFLFFFLFINLSSFFVVSASDLYYNGDKVFIDDGNVYISASPYSLHGSGWVEYEFLYKRGSLDVDFAIGVNSSLFTATCFQVWKSYEHEVVGWHYENFYQTIKFVDCVSYENIGISNYYNYSDVLGTVNNSRFIELFYDGGNSSVYLAFDSYYSNGSDYYFVLETCNLVDYVYFEVFYDWFTVSKSPEVYYFDYGLNDKWFVFSDVSVVKDVLYKYRVYFSVPVSLNGSFGKYSFCVKPSSESFSYAVGAGHFYELDPWWDAQWLYRRRIWVQESMLDDDLINFPVRINITDAYMKLHVAQSDGGDICFISYFDNVTQYFYDLVEWNSSNGYLRCYVNVTDLDSDVNTSFWMYYGNAVCSNQENEDFCYDSSWLAVYHMNSSTTKSCYDSSGYGNHGVYEDLPVMSNAGYEFGIFFGGSQNMRFPERAGGFQKNGSQLFLIEHQDDDSNSHVPLFHFDGSGTTYRCPNTEIRYADNKIYVEWKWGTGGYDYQVRNPLTVDTFYCMAHANADQEWYMDAVSMASLSYNTADFLSVYRYFGSNSAPASYILGNVYEFWLSDDRLSDNVVEALCGNLKNNSFIVVCGEEALGIVNNIPFCLNFAPFNHSGVYSCWLINISVDIFDNDSNLISWSIWLDNGFSSSGSSYNSTIYLNFTYYLLHNNSFYYWVNLTDGIDYAKYRVNFTTLGSFCSVVGCGVVDVELGLGLLVVVMLLFCLYLCYKLSVKYVGLHVGLMVVSLLLIVLCSNVLLSLYSNDYVIYSLLLCYGLVFLLLSVYKLIFGIRKLDEE